MVTAISGCQWSFTFGGDPSYIPSSTSTSTNTSTTSDTSSDSTSSISDTSSSSSSSSSNLEVNTLEAKKASINYKNYTKYNASPISSAPCVGAAHILVIPVWFTDSGSYISNSGKNNVRSDIEKTYFGTNEDTGWRSVKSFYEEESHGALTYTGTVSEWYSCGQASSYYATSSARTASLVTTASNWYFSNHSDARTNYDKDGDGYLDSVMLIYGAPDYLTAENSNTNLWAYCYWIQNSSAQNASNPGANVFFWASYDFMYSSTKAYQRTGKSNYGGGDTSYCSLDTHTYIHEMGHVFGLEDYYDYSKTHNPAAGFSMQDNNVGGHDPFSSYALGWGKAYIPTETTTIYLKPFQDTGEMILLSPSPDSNNSPFAEYLLLEYYTATGLNKFDCDRQYNYPYDYPQGPNTRGIRLWHVDARLVKYDRYSGQYSLTSNPPSQSNEVKMAMSNTYDNGSIDEEYLSPLGSSYYNYNILQLIRNNTSSNVNSFLNNNLKSGDLFKANDTFSMSTYKYQFVKNGKLNTNVDLGFTFTVNTIGTDSASITVTKL